VEGNISSVTGRISVDVGVLAEKFIAVHAILASKRFEIRTHERIDVSCVIRRTQSTRTLIFFFTIIRELDCRLMHAE